MGYEYDASSENAVVIKVIGVGGGGNNAVNRMIEANVRSVDFVAVNTDKVVLMRNAAPTKIAIGEKLTKGHGAGGNPTVGTQSAQESLEEINNVLKGADMVFITSGMGGGTGTGAAPVVAKAAKDMGILTVGVVTKPFGFEGSRRMLQAEQGIAELREYVDSLIVVPNERLKQVSETRITFANAFEIADDVLRHAIQSISDLINIPGHINLDFADAVSVMRDAGYAHMGIGTGSGRDKAEVAAKTAISSPLLETSIAGANGIIVNITASPDISLDEVDIAMNLITKEADPSANIQFGVRFDNSFEDAMSITVIATGFNSTNFTTNNRPNIGALKMQETAVSRRPAAMRAPTAPSMNTKEQTFDPHGKEELISDKDLGDVLGIFNK